MSVNAATPALRPPRVSILTSAEILDLAGDRWWGQIHTRVLSGDPTDTALGIESGDLFILPVCLDGETKEPFPRTDTRVHTPFVIYATDDCSSYGSATTDFLDRAKQKLAVNEAWSIERMLWDGDPSIDGFSFVDTGIAPLDTGAHPLLGFALLDSTVAENRTDGRGMIHMTTKVFDLLQQYNLFRREGNIWLSPLDNIVVPGRGYSGNGPDDEDESATSSWMFGHPGIIGIARSEVMTLPENDDELIRQMDYRHNDILALAERVVAYVIQNNLDDGDTGVFSVSVDPTAALSAGGGGGSAPDYSALLTAISAATSDTDTNTDALEALVTALGTNTDTLETLVAATNTALATSDARLANLEDTLTADAATLSNVASSATNVTVAASNANRRGLMLHNDSTAILYLKFGATASTTSFSVKIAADSYYEMSMPVYQGQIDGIWASANGAARITELT